MNSCLRLVTVTAEHAAETRPASAACVTVHCCAPTKVTMQDALTSSWQKTSCALCSVLRAVCPCTTLNTRISEWLSRALWYTNQRNVAPPAGGRSQSGGVRQYAWRQSCRHASQPRRTTARTRRAIAPRPEVFICHIARPKRSAQYALNDNVARGTRCLRDTAAARVRRHVHVWKISPEAETSAAKRPGVERRRMWVRACMRACRERHAHSCTAERGVCDRRDSGGEAACGGCSATHSVPPCSGGWRGAAAPIGRATYSAARSHKEGRGGVRSSTRMCRGRQRCPLRWRCSSLRCRCSSQGDGGTAQEPGRRHRQR